MFFFYGETDGVQGYSAGGHVTTNLILHLDAADATSYPGTGTTWADISGNGNDATFIETSGDISYSTDNGGVMDLNGGYFSVANDLDMSNDVTWEFFYKPTNMTDSGKRLGLLIKNYEEGVLNPNASNSLNLYMWGGGRGPLQQIQIWNWAGGYNAYDDQWHQLTVVRDLSNTIDPTTRKIYFYVNGVLVHEDVRSVYWDSSSGEYLLPAPGSIPKGTQPTRIAGGVYDPVIGQMGVVRIYDKPLTAVEVLQNYDANKERYGLT